MPTDPARRELHRAWNAARGDGGPGAAPHRAKVTGELLRGVDPAAGAALTLLGAGRCGDVDLPALLGGFASVTAADFDADALAAGFTAQGVAGDPRVTALGGADLMPLPAGRDGFLEACGDPPVPAGLAGAADVAGSLCVLTQLIDHALARVGHGHSQAAGVAGVVRAGHLRQLAGCLKPGGLGLLVTDLLSEATCPDLLTASDADAPAVIAAALERGNVFRGVSPAHLLRAVREDPALGPRVARSQLLRPWVWRPGERAFAVTAVRFRLKS